MNARYPTPCAASRSRSTTPRSGDRSGSDRVTQIPREQILELLRSRGQDDKAGQAEQELPNQVDTDQHADLLQRLGINPQDLLGQLGGLANKLGL